MIESFSELFIIYKNACKDEVCNACSAFSERKENIKILKNHIISLENKILNRLKNCEKDFPMDCFKLLSKIRPKDFSVARTYIESYALMLYSITDITAMFLYYLLNFKTKKKNIYLHTLLIEKGEKPKQNISLEQYNNGLIHSAVSEFCKSPEYKYFNALNNYIKHNSIIKVPHSLKLNEVENNFSINEFTHKGKTYPTVTTEELFKKSEIFICGLESCIDSVKPSNK